MTQPAIAEKVGTDQSTISLYSKRFSERAAEIGLLEAAKEYNMYNEIGELRNLSVEMQKYNLTTEDAREGVGIIKLSSAGPRSLAPKQPLVPQWLAHHP